MTFERIASTPQKKPKSQIKPRPKSAVALSSGPSRIKSSHAMRALEAAFVDAALHGAGDASLEATTPDVASSAANKVQCATAAAGDAECTSSSSMQQDCDFTPLSELTMSNQDQSSVATAVTTAKTVKSREPTNTVEESTQTSLSGGVVVSQLLASADMKPEVAHDAVELAEHSETYNRLSSQEQVSTHESTGRQQSQGLSLFKAVDSWEKFALGARHFHSSDFISSGMKSDLGDSSEDVLDDCIDRVLSSGEDVTAVTQAASESVIVQDIDTDTTVLSPVARLNPLAARVQKFDMRSLLHSADDVVPLPEVDHKIDPKSASEELPLVTSLSDNSGSLAATDPSDNHIESQNLSLTADYPEFSRAGLNPLARAQKIDIGALVGSASRLDSESNLPSSTEVSASL